jgi:Uncharacterized conserved protein
LKGILLIAHGSKVAETEKIVDSVALKIVETTRLITLPSYMEFNKPSIYEGAELLIERGVTEIIAVPMFIYCGIHVSKDIPNEIEKISKKHKDVKIIMTGCIGDDDMIARILINRILEVTDIIGQDIINL